MNNWRNAAAQMYQNSRGTENFEVFHHGNIHTVVFHETYDSESTGRLEGPAIQSAYRTFSFNSATGTPVQLSDVVDISAIPNLGAPYIQAALDHHITLPNEGEQALEDRAEPGPVFPPAG